MIDTHWAFIWWTWHWDREGTKEKLWPQHGKLLWSAENVGQGDGVREGFTSAQGDMAVRWGPPSRGAPALVRYSLAGLQQPSWSPSFQHSPGSEARRSVGSSSEHGSASTCEGTGRAGPHRRTDCFRQHFRIASTVVSWRAHDSEWGRTPAFAMLWYCHGECTLKIMGFMLIFHRIIESHFHRIIFVMSQMFFISCHKWLYLPMFICIVIKKKKQN